MLAPSGEYRWSEIHSNANGKQGQFWNCIVYRRRSDDVYDDDTNCELGE